MKHEQQQEPQKQVISDDNFLIIVYGLPASGKSTFARHLKQKLFPSAILISSDNIEKQIFMHSDLQIQFEKYNSEELVIKLQQLAESKTQKPIFNAQVWKKSRKLVQKIISQIIKTKPVILQDDLLLHSQRKPFRKISWMNKIKYLQILMDTSIEQCINNLSMRKQANGGCVVTQQVIKNAANKLQKDEQSIKLGINNRNITKQQIMESWRVIQIKPNDPNDQNDPNYQHEKPKHSHSSVQLKQIEARNLIHKIMNYSDQQIQTKFGQKFKNIKTKKQLGSILSNWKKSWISSAKKKQEQKTIQQHLFDFLQKQNI